MLTQALTSLQHPIVKYVVKLRQNRQFRREENNVLICGTKLIYELAEHIPIQTLFYQSEFEIPKPLPCKKIYTITEPILKKITGLEKPDPMAAIVNLPRFYNLSHASYLLVLDGISDPGNLGTLLRTALALGWNGVFITSNSCDPFNEKALRAAKGATFLLPIYEGPWEEFVTLARETARQVFVADMHGDSIEGLSLHPPIALVLSRESQGARQEAKTLFKQISVPMEGPMESLNVASAGAILLHTIRKSRCI